MGGTGANQHYFDLGAGLKDNANTKSRTIPIPGTLNFASQPVREYTPDNVFGDAPVNAATQTNTDAGVRIPICGSGHSASQRMSKDLESSVHRKTEPWTKQIVPYLNGGYVAITRNRRLNI